MKQIMMNVKRSKKICSMQGCSTPLFARGYCRFHYGTEYLLAKQAKKPHKSYNIPRITAKRSSQVTKYHSNRKLFIMAERESHPEGKIFCIFCDKEILGEPSLHHAIGRDDESILDEAFWFLSHNHCHVDEYHAMSCNDLWWWENYMFRMKNINPMVYEKDLKRQEKA